MGAHIRNCIAIFASLITGIGSAASPAAAQVPGDFNGDGWVGGTDRSQILGCSLEGIPASPLCTPLDTDGDGDVDVDDIIKVVELATASGGCTPAGQRALRRRVVVEANYTGGLPGFSGVSGDIKIGRVPILCDEPLGTIRASSAAHVGLVEPAGNNIPPRHVQIGYARVRGYTGVPLPPTISERVYGEFKGQQLATPGSPTTWYDIQYFAPAPPPQATVNYTVERVSTFSGQFRYFYNGTLLYSYSDPSMVAIELRSARFSTEVLQTNSRMVGSATQRCQFSSLQVGLGFPAFYNDADLTSAQDSLSAITGTDVPLPRGTGLPSNAFSVWDIR